MVFFSCCKLRVAGYFYIYVIDVIYSPTTQFAINIIYCVEILNTHE